MVKEKIKAREKAIKEGREEGRRAGIIQVAKEMVKNKMKDEDILKVTHISKKDLENLKLQIT